MEIIAPPLKLLLVMRRSLEKNQSVRQGLQNYLAQEKGDFSIFVSRWYSLLQQGQSVRDFLNELPSLHRRILLQVLERGLRGEAVYATLCQLENEMIEAAQDEIGIKLARLPMLLLIPLLFFQFPAILMLLFGPLLQNFFHSFGGG
jgi:hypothetical protein